MDKVYLPEPPRRTVSLVPSITESLFDLGFGDSVVGVTDYCIHPAKAISNLPRIGGPKNARASEIIALHPDIVFANQEENTPEIVQTLLSAGIPVWVFFPKTVQQAVNDLWDLAGLYQSEEGGRRVHTVEVALDWATALSQDREPVRYFCPIWQEERSENPWWMTFNADTYSNDLLRILGGENIFAKRMRRFPLKADLDQGEEEDAAGRDVRYPRVSFDEIVAGQPEVILLPDEPYRYNAGDKQRFAEWFQGTPAVKNSRIDLLDGSLLTWPGTRLGRALNEISNIFDL
jgi:ABC-type Fe3+-hydroxamate transport system substrate-binding protein